MSSGKMPFQFNLINLVWWVVGFFAVVFIFSYFDNSFLGDVLYFILPFVGLFILWWILIDLWDYLRAYYWYKWFLNIDYTVLEIKLPREHNKTPQAMEYVFNGLWEPSDDEGWWYDSWLKIATRPVLSFEMASIGGTVHFFFWVPKKYIPRVESHVYAQYPNAEVIEVPDYTRTIPFHKDTHKLMGFEYKLTRPDPIPIRTYKMMKLDANMKDEENFDPITQTIEVMSSIGPHEQMWVQFVTMMHKDTKTVRMSMWDRIVSAWNDENPFQLFQNKKVDWRKDYEAELEKIKAKYTSAEDADKLAFAGRAMPQDDEFMKLISENVTKPAFDVGIRQIYFAPLEHWNGAQPANMGSAYKAYTAAEPFNNLQPSLIPAPNGKAWHIGRNELVAKIKLDLYDDYISRKFFMEHAGYGYGFAEKKYHTYVFSTEELATIYHFPGGVSQTPSFERIETATSEAPANLPTGEGPGNLPV